MNLFSGASVTEAKTAAGRLYVKMFGAAKKKL